MSSRHMCNVCGKNFKQKTLLEDHTITAHEGSKNYKCAVCHKAFSLEKYCKVHYRNVHLGGTFECEVCEKVIVGCMANLKNHMKRVHEGVKNHKCPLCDRGFSLR